MGISFNEVTHLYPGTKKHELLVALENINLNINEHGEFIAIVGHTGAGKSTLLQHMNGLALPTKGQVVVFDSVITSKKRKNPKMKPIRKRVGFVFQFPEYQLFEETVLKDIMFAPKNFGYKEAVAKEKALAAAKLVDLPEALLEKSPFNLSGGEMRKVAIAGILSYDPDIILLDEPTRGLDPKGALEVMELFKKICYELNKTIVLITHDMDIVYEYANRVIALKDGKIVYDGYKQKLFSECDYESFHLEKPEMLRLIDYLNKSINANLSYSITNMDALLEALRGVK